MGDAAPDRSEVAHLQVADALGALPDRGQRRAFESFARSSSAQVVRAPMRSSPSRTSTPRRSSREMSTTTDGRAIRSFMTGSERLAAGESLRVLLCEELERMGRGRSRARSASAQGSRGRSDGSNRLHDRLVAGAAAEVAAQRAPDLVVARRGLREQVGGGEDHPRRAEAALQAVVLHEGALQRVQLAVGASPRSS